MIRQVLEIIVLQFQIKSYSDSETITLNFTKKYSKVIGGNDYVVLKYMNHEVVHIR